MSLTVQHLNADSTFLLTFAPEPTSSGSIYARQTFTILCDPWLVGDSIVTHPKFALTKHTVRPYIEDLKLLPEPHVIIVSQNKPDHCHKKTLQQLPPSCETYIVAEPGAAKAIRRWKHFDPFHIIGLPKYNPLKKDSQIRFDIPPLTPEGLPGEVAIAFIPAKNYMTGLHNAIGITYQAPTATKAVSSVSTVDLPPQNQEFPLSPPMSTFPPLPRPRTSCSSNESSSHHNFHQDPPLSPPSSSTSASRSATDLPQTVNSRPINFSYPLTPPESPLSTATFNSNATTLNESIQAMNSNGINLKRKCLGGNHSYITPGRPRPISVLYTPHGIPYDPDLMPYVTNHFVPAAALPLDLLLHSFDRAQNPWYFGGNISAGSRGGCRIARGLMAKAWVSAHDEAKDDTGISVSRLKTTRMNAVDVKVELQRGDDGEWFRRRGWNCDVRSLGVGQAMTLVHPPAGLMRNSF